MGIERDLSSPLPWRSSLRASRDRRGAQTRRRRRMLRGRAGVTLAVATMAFAAAGAVAQDSPPAGGGSSAGSGASGSSVSAIQRALGVAADGVYGPQTRAAVRRFQRREGLAVDGVAGPATLARIGQCESGGDPTAVSADGHYRGKYQFDRATWERMGGSGDPAQAGEAEQDRIAAKLLAQRGTSPWPVCGG